MTKPSSRLPDVPRLMKLKDEVRQRVLGEDTASSIAAFIAWKALLLASGLQPGGSERARLHAAVEDCLRNSPDLLRKPVVEFAAALSRLSGASVTPAVRSEWLGDPRELPSQVEAALRQIKRLSKAVNGARDESLYTVADDIALNLLRVRHVVLGHAQVTTGTPFYPTIVPAFEALVTQLATIQHQRLNSRS